MGDIDIYPFSGASSSMNALSNAFIDFNEEPINNEPFIIEKVQHEVCFAARDNDLDRLQKAVFYLSEKEEGELNTWTLQGYTPLHFAAAKGNSEMVAFLLNSGYDRDVLDKYGNTPLIWAVASGSIKVVEDLLDFGANVNICNWTTEGESPLIIAASNGMDDIVEMLILNGAKVNNKCLSGATAIHIAAISDKITTIALLARYGACLDIGDDEGDSPVHYCVREGKYNSLKTLIKYGVYLNGINEDGETPLDLARDCKDIGSMSILTNNGALTAEAIAQTHFLERETTKLTYLFENMKTTTTMDSTVSPQVLEVDNNNNNNNNNNNVQNTVDYHLVCNSNGRGMNDEGVMMMGREVYGYGHGPLSLSF